MPHLPPGSVPVDAQRDKESPGRAGAFKETSHASRDQGALDAPILSQGTNQARRGSRKRPARAGTRTGGPGLAITQVGCARYGQVTRLVRRTGEVTYCFLLRSRSVEAASPDGQAVQNNTGSER